MHLLVTRLLAPLIALIVVTSSGCNLAGPRSASVAADTGQASMQASAKSLHSVEKTSVGQVSTPALPGDDLWLRLRNGFTLDHSGDRRLKREIEWFASHPKYIARVFGRARPYLHLITEAIERRGMPAEIALLPVVESAFQPFAYSPGRAAGLWQFIPGTGKRFGLKQNWWYDGRRDVVRATEAALDYLELLHREFDGDWLLALAAYNCGERTVGRAVKRNLKQGKPIDFWHLKLPRETSAYVPRLLAISTIVAEPSKYNITLAPFPNEAVVVEVETGGQIDLAVAADLAAIDIKELYRLNPAFNRWATDPAGPHHLLVPLDKAENLQTALLALPKSERLQWQRHRIREGETLSHIAQRYRITVDVLKQANRLRTTRIRAGRHLLIPSAQRDAKHYALSAESRRQRVANRPRKGAKTIHTVRSGDTLWDISRSYDIRVKDITGWNSMAPRDVLKPGQQLTLWLKSKKNTSIIRTALPIETTRKIHYTVRNGDSLYLIGKRFNVSITDLRRWNKAAKKKYLQPGDRLTLYVDVTRTAENT